MGRIIDTKTFQEGNISKRESILNSSSYARFIDSKPTFVDYYNICPVESTVDQGFGTIDEVVGYDSPVRYNKVRDFVLMNLERLDLNTAYAEYGLQHEVRADAIVLPNTITPLVNDLFRIHHLNRIYVFKVESVNRDALRDNNYYKIDFVLYRVLEDNEVFPIHDSKIAKSFIMKYDGKNTSDYFLMRDEDYNLSDKVTVLYRELKSLYKDKYYDCITNSFIYKEDINQIIYDPYMSEFVSKVNIFTEPLSYKGIHTRRRVLGGDYDFTKIYKNTIFNSIVDKKHRVPLNRILYLPKSKSNTVYARVSGDLNLVNYFDSKLMTNNTHTIISEEYKSYILKGYPKPEEDRVEEDLVTEPEVEDIELEDDEVEVTSSIIEDNIDVKDSIQLTSMYDFDDNISMDENVEESGIIEDSISISDEISIEVVDGEKEVFHDYSDKEMERVIIEYIRGELDIYRLIDLLNLMVEDFDTSIYDYIMTPTILYISRSILSSLER